MVHGLVTSPFWKSVLSAGIMVRDDITYKSIVLTIYLAGIGQMRQLQHLRFLNSNIYIIHSIYFSFFSLRNSKVWFKESQMSQLSHFDFMRNK